MKTLQFKITENTLISIFESISDHIVILDKDLNIIWANRVYSERFGLNINDIIGKKCYKLLEKKDAPCIDCPNVKALHTGKIENIEKVRDEGRYYILTGIPIYEKGQIKAVVEIGKEITEKKVIDEKFKETIKLEGVYEILDNVAHQFNNIFNGIYGFSQLLKNRVDDKELLDLIDNVTTSVEKGSKFIKALLGLKKTPSIQKVFDLNFLIISTKNVIKHIVGEKIKLEFILTKEAPLIKGDPMQIREVVLELIQNSRNAIHDTGTISISIEKMRIGLAEKVVLTISDTGCGMDEEIIQHVIKPLFTTDPGRFGMGLPIIRNIVNKHNGELEIKSKLRYGTTVKIYFPAVSQSNASK